MKKMKVFGIVVLSMCVLSIVLIAGCTSAVPGPSVSNTANSLPDPQTGVQNWVEGMNEKNFPMLYALQPGAFRQNVTYAQFVQGNRGNIYVSPNASIQNYEVLNETVNGTMANLKVVVNWNLPENLNSPDMKMISMFYNFDEFYENGAWRVWVMPW